MTFEELSQELRKARLEKKWRPRDIARRTRIQDEYIKLIESGDFSFMPETIIRGYIKSYSRDVGLDQNEMIERYEQAKSQLKEENLKPLKPEEKKPEEKKRKITVEQKIEKPEINKLPQIPAATKVEEVKEKTKERKEKVEAKKESGDSVIAPVESIPSKTNKNQTKKDDPKVDDFPEIIESKILHKEEKLKGKKTAPVKSLKIVDQKADSFLKKFRSEIILAGLFLIVIISIVLIYLKFGTDYFSKEEKPVKKISVFEAREQNLEEETAKKVEEEQIRVPDTVRLRILAAEETWFRLITDSTETSEFIFQPGESKTFEADKQLELKVGRADGLFFWVNEDSLGILGSAGEIIGKLVVGPQGIIMSDIRAPQPNRPARKDSTVILLP